MKVLVTGGSGFIGQHVVSLLLACGHEIKKYDTKTGFDITNYEALVKESKGCDAIVHLAAKVRVQECEQNPGETMRINAAGTENVLHAACENSVKRILIASSAAVYGNNPNVPLNEDAQTMPINIYGNSKLAAEKIAQNYINKGMNVACFRIFNVFGPGQDADSQYSAAIPIFISRALQNKDLVIYGDGRQTRDFIYAKDVASAFLSALDKNHSGVFNLASGKAISIFDLAEEIVKLTKSESKITFAAPRAGDILHSSANILRMRSLLNFEQKYSVEEGLKETIAWFMACAPSSR